MEQVYFFDDKVELIERATGSGECRAQSVENLIEGKQSLENSSKHARLRTSLFGIRIKGRYFRWENSASGKKIRCNWSVHFMLAIGETSAKTCILLISSMPLRIFLPFHFYLVQRSHSSLCKSNISQTSKSAAF